MVDREQVVLAYQLLLDREPETESVIEEKSSAENLDVVIEGVVGSEEFMARHRLALTRLFS